MKVILTEDVKNLGYMGEVVEVAAGYGRNYLIRAGLAHLADERNLEALEHQKKVAADKRRKLLKDAETLKGRIESLSVTLKAKAGEQDQLFGSVTNKDVAEALAEEGIVVNRRSIVIEEPIKSLGLFNLPVKLPEGVEAKLKVWVVKE